LLLKENQPSSLLPVAATIVARCTQAPPWSLCQADDLVALHNFQHTQPSPTFEKNY